MKKTLLTLIAWLCVTCCAAQQGYNATELIEDGKVWKMLYSNVEASDIYPDYEYSYYIKGDTVVAGKSCKKLYSSTRTTMRRLLMKWLCVRRMGKCILPHHEAIGFMFYTTGDVMQGAVAT